MIRRLGVVSLFVVLLAFAGGAAGSARPLPSLRLLASVTWLAESDQVEPKAEPTARPVAWTPATTASAAPRSASLRRFPVERWLFQRPPPVAL